VLTSIAAAVNFIAFLALPGTFYFFIGLLVASKLYMNSMLATLNSRQHMSRTAHSSDHDWNSIPIGPLPNRRVRVVTPVTSTDSGVPYNDHEDALLSSNIKSDLILHSV